MTPPHQPQLHHSRHGGVSISTISHAFLVVVVALLLVSSMVVPASATTVVDVEDSIDEFTATNAPLYPRQVVCPTDENLMGYTSIDAINMDIQRAVSLIMSPNHTPPEQYVYTICPNTILNGQHQLSPVLHNSHFICGRDGYSTDNCRIEHGTTQVLIIDTNVEPYPRAPVSGASGAYAMHGGGAGGSAPRLFVFKGLTFAHSRDVSVAAVASTTTFAEFYDCHWKKGFQQQVGILIALGQVVPSPFAISDMVYRLVDNVDMYDGNDNSATTLEASEFSNDEEDLGNLFKSNVRSPQDGHYGLGENEGLGPAVTSIWHSDSEVLGQNKLIESKSKPMTVYLVDSTFTDEAAETSEGFLEGHSYHLEQEQEYRVKDLVYRPIFNSGHLHMSNVIIRGHSSSSSATSSATVGSSTTQFAINLVKGSALIEDCTFTDNRVNAIVRPIQGSQVTIRRSIFSRNDVSGTVVTAGQSNITLDESYFEDNTVRKGQVVVLDDSHADIQDSCFVTTHPMTFTPVVIDSTSKLEQQKGNFAGEIAVEDKLLSSVQSSNLRSGSGWNEDFVPGTVTAASLTNNGFCPSDEGHIFFETSEQTCLSLSGENSFGVEAGCEGSCITFDAAACPLPVLWSPTNSGNNMAANSSSMSAPMLSTVRHTALVVSLSLVCTATSFVL